MKIIVATTLHPFQYREDMWMAKPLVEKLKEFGHQAILVQIPFSRDNHNVMEQMLALRLQHIETAAERLICLQAPSYLLRHDEKYLWLLNHMNCKDAVESNMNFAGNIAMHEYVARADDLALSEARMTYVKSKKMLLEISKAGNIAETPLYPPLCNPDAFHCTTYGDYFYCSAPICSEQRQLLLVEAMKHIKTEAHLVISGNIVSPSYFDKVCAAIKENHLENKITLIANPISENEKLEFYAKCLATIYVPNETYCRIDAVLEAAYSEKAVITCLDSDEIVELITNEVSGFVVQPQPAQLAQIIDRLFENCTQAEKMGQANCRQIRAMDISWNKVIGRLTE